MKAVLFPTRNRLSFLGPLGEIGIFETPNRLVLRAPGRRRAVAGNSVQRCNTGSHPLQQNNDITKRVRQR
jgi:hypothetical protein